MDLISIIVPVYNARTHLAECLDSILEQTYPELEIILVDDGSTDDSLRICQAYARRDCRIRLIHRKNGGEAAARKAGLRASTGSIITFVDSDDWIAPQAIENLYTEMRDGNADIAVSGYTEVRGNQEKVVQNRIRPGIYRGEQLETNVFSKMLCCADYFELGLWPYFWNKLFKRELIEPYLRELNEKLVVGVDAVGVFPVLLAAKTIVITQDASYHYRIHQASIMHRFRSGEQEVENIRIQYRELTKVFARSGYETIMRPQTGRYILHHLIVRAADWLDRKLREMGETLIEGIPDCCSVILYGAGAFGTSLHEMYEKSDFVTVAGWCDRDYRELQGDGCAVISMDEALQREFDFIVIAVLNQKTKEQIQSGLTSRGIKQEQIKWLNRRALDKINLSDLLSCCSEDTSFL